MRITVEIPKDADVATAELTCKYFARCTNGTRNMVKHPTLEAVPCCDRCAGRFDLTLYPITFINASN